MPKQEYSRGDVRRMLGISERQLRGWERSGLIAAAAVFSFSDLIALKTLKSLREKHISVPHISRALQALQHKLEGVQRPLSELRIVSNGRTIAVQIAGQRMEAVSGQWLLDFETAGLAAIQTIPENQPNRAVSVRESEAHFQHGLALEETGAPIEQAIEAYRKAVDLNPAAAGAWVNLGTIYYRMGQYAEAERYYRESIQADPQYPLAFFNLGNLYDEQGDISRARECYQRALGLNRGYADAHFNLALLCERAGEPMKAVFHWKQYLKLDSHSSWADIARRQLEKLRQATLIPGARG